jgi:hypothetical protein
LVLHLIEPLVLVVGKGERLAIVCNLVVGEGVDAVEKEALVAGRSLEKE